MNKNGKAPLPVKLGNQFTVLFYRLSLFLHKTAETHRKENSHFSSGNAILQNCGKPQKPNI
jgi:hypothetical protein